MTTTLIILIALVLYVAVYLLYGKRIAHNVAKLDATAKTPAHRLYDGVDYVPSKWPVVFGHHFASIAGAGPIVGPIQGVTWGWGAAILWIWFGNAFIGAVHDFMALVASIRIRRPLHSVGRRRGQRSRGCRSSSVSSSTSP